MKPDRSDPAGWHANTRLKIRHLVLIERLASLRNVRSAAQSMNFSQPAATKLLKEAEGALGTILFSRSRRGVVPTEIGEAVIFRVRQILNDLDAARRDVALLAKGSAGRLRVGTFPVAAPILLPRAITLFLMEAPAVNIVIEEGTRDRLIPALESGELDVVVGRLTEEQMPASLLRLPLYAEETSVVCGPSHPLARKRRIGPLDLAPQRWILPPYAAPLRVRLSAMLAAANPSAPLVAIESDSLLANVALLHREHFISVLPATIAHKFAKHGELVVLPVSLGPMLPDVGIIKRVMQEDPPLLRSFVMCLQSVGIEMRQWIPGE